MDNVTHALAGCLLAAATVSIVERRAGTSPPGFRTAAALVGIVAAELPDADLLYAGPVLGIGKVGYLLHHRGHTHTLIFAIAGALLIWGAVLALRRDVRGPPVRLALLGLALGGTLSHLVLDFGNSYGVHPFWPLDNAWYYGDAIFIIEPWLWIAAIPPLLLFARSISARVLLGVSLAGILAAAWWVDMVGQGVAFALTMAAAAWIVLVRVALPARRVLCGIVAWCSVEGVFFASSRAARNEVRAAVGLATLRDVVLTPAVGNPLCFRALVVELDGATYRVTHASVAPFPVVRSVARCGAASHDFDERSRVSARTATRSVTWGREWSAPRNELIELAANNCEIAAALRFVRVPVWRRLSDGTIQFSDLRYGVGDDSFASIVARERPARCPSAIPEWTPPRSDVLRGG